MSGRRIASERRDTHRRVFASVALTLAAHAVLGGSMEWATQGPGLAFPTARPLPLEWPAPSEPLAPHPAVSLRVSSGEVPAAPPVGPIDVGTSVLGPRFDPRVPPGGDAPGDRTDAPLTAAAPWSAALVENAPTLLAGPTPVYPEALRRAGITGSVVVQAVIDTLGRAEPGSVTVIATPHLGFVAAARHYMLGAVFRPARVQGHPVRVLVQVPIAFMLTQPQ